MVQEDQEVPEVQEDQEDQVDQVEIMLQTVHMEEMVEDVTSLAVPMVPADLAVEVQNPVLCVTNPLTSQHPSPSQLLLSEPPCNPCQPLRNPEWQSQS